MKHNITLIVALQLLPLAGLTATEPSRPNIVYILCDDLGYGDFVMETDWAVGEVLKAIDDPNDDDALKEGLPSIQLYNMHDDIGEKTNIEGQNAKVVKRLTKLLEKYVADGRSTAGAPQKNDVPVDIWHAKSGKVIDEK